MMINKERITREYTTVLSATPEQIFPLLCPVREYDWLPHWNCAILYTRTGVAEAGCVFATDFADEFGREIWIVNEYSPSMKIAFIRTGEYRITRYQIMLAAVKGGTEITWRQEITALNDESQALVSGYTEERFLSLMQPLNRMLHTYLKKVAPLER